MDSKTRHWQPNYLEPPLSPACGIEEGEKVGSERRAQKKRALRCMSFRFRGNDSKEIFRDVLFPPTVPPRADPAGERAKDGALVSTAMAPIAVLLAASITETLLLSWLAEKYWRAAAKASAARKPGVARQHRY